MDPLITASELAGYLQKDLDKYAAELAVAGASGIIRAYCGWGLSRIMETLTIDSCGGRSVNLPTLRLNDVTAVRVDGDALTVDAYGWGTNGVLVFTPATDYRPYGYRRVEADVDHGYDPIPDEVRIVACAMAGRLYSNPEGLTAKASGDTSRSYGAVLSELEMRLIYAYRLI